MIPLPWSDADAPNFMLEITSKCNVYCAACYANLGSEHKSFEQVKAELKTACRLRPVDTVTITGGEPLLHPDLGEIIRHIAQEGYHVFLLTNGVLVNEQLLSRLKDEGLDDILFHVDRGQKRPDCSSILSLDEVFSIQEKYLEMAKMVGLGASISYTFYDESYPELHKLLEWFLNHKSVTMLFLAKAGYSGKPVRLDRGPFNRLSQFLEDNYGLKPFAYIRPTGSGNVPVWYSYFIPIRRNNRTLKIYPYSGTIADICLIRLGKWMKGRYTHRMPKSSILVLLRVMTHALVTLRFRSAWKFLKSEERKNPLSHKIIAYDDGPHVTESGEVVRCDFCPTAILKENHLVRCCEC